MRVNFQLATPCGCKNPTNPLKFELSMHNPLGISYCLHQCYQLRKIAVS